MSSGASSTPAACLKAAASSLAEAKRFWELVGKPNAMIKIPANPEGIAAIRDATAAVPPEPLLPRTGRVAARVSAATGVPLSVYPVWHGQSGDYWLHRAAVATGDGDVGVGPLRRTRARRVAAGRFAEAASWFTKAIDATPANTPLDGRIRPHAPGPDRRPGGPIRHMVRSGSAPLRDPVFRRLAVFVGGFELGAAEAVCDLGDLPTTVLDLLAPSNPKARAAHPQDFYDDTFAKAAVAAAQTPKQAS